MKSYFPTKDKQYIQTNRSNIFGNLWSSFNLDLQSNLGTLRLGPKLKLNVDSATEANLGCPVAFKHFDGRIFALAGTRVYYNSSAYLNNYSWTADASAGVVTTYTADVSDFEVFNSALAASNNDGKVYSKVSNGSGTGAWTDRAGNLGSGVHKLVYFKKFDRLYATMPAAGVRSYSAAWTPTVDGDDYSLTILNSADKGQISTIAATTDSLWIGLIRTSNSVTNSNRQARGVIWQWDGISQQITREYFLDAQGCVAIYVDNDIPYAMDSNGCLLKFTGSSFEEIGRLPLDLAYLTNATSTVNNRFIHPNGMAVTKNNTILCLINNLLGEPDSKTAENLPSGLWEWSAENGFVHRSTFTYTQLALSTITDFGQERISRVGALVLGNIYLDTAPRSTIICGATFFTNATSTAHGIFNDSPIPIGNTTEPEGIKHGYFVTTWFESDEMEEAWGKLWTGFKQLGFNDKMVFKYRTVEEDAVEATITWVNTTSFTVDNSAVDIDNYWTSGTGGEVEITQGTGSGSCAHITNAVNVAGTWTVTIDEIITGVTTGTAKARFQNWVKIGSVTGASADDRQWFQLAIEGANDTRIQLKGYLVWLGNGEFYKSVIFSDPNIIITH